MKLRKLLILLILFSSGSYAQHNSLYSQYYFSGILINPAYAGSQNALNFTSIYRNQWTGIEGAPKNLSIGLHSPLKSNKVNAGLIFLNSKYGLSSITSVMGIYAYRLSLGKGSLSFGLQGGIQSSKNNWSQIETTDGNDPVFTSPATREISGIAGFGMYYKAEKFFLGLSSPTMYNSKKSFQFSYSPVLLSAGVLIQAGNSVVFKPSALIKYIKGSPIGTDISTVLYFKEIIGIGVGYRTKDAIYAFVDLKLNEQFSAGYCYDYTTSHLKRYSNGSHEFMLRYLFSYKLNTKNPRYF
jgi:type IX secretion system PorP/SprF family membrane protein